MDENLTIDNLLKKNSGYQWIKPECSVTEISEILGQIGIHALLVGDEKKLLGIITHIDVVKVCRAKEFGKQKAKDIMSSPVITVDTSNSIEELKKTFEETEFIIIPVVSKSREVIGVVSVLDFFKRIK